MKRYKVGDNIRFVENGTYENLNPDFIGATGVILNVLDNRYEVCVTFTNGSAATFNDNCKLSELIEIEMNRNGANEC